MCGPDGVLSRRALFQSKMTAEGGKWATAGGGYLYLVVVKAALRKAFHIQVLRGLDQLVQKSAIDKRAAKNIGIKKPVKSEGQQGHYDRLSQSSEGQGSVLSSRKHMGFSDSPAALEPTRRKHTTYAGSRTTPVMTPPTPTGGRTAKRPNSNRPLPTRANLRWKFHDHERLWTDSAEPRTVCS